MGNSGKRLETTVAKRPRRSFEKNKIFYEIKRLQKSRQQKSGNSGNRITLLTRSFVIKMSLTGKAKTTGLDGKPLVYQTGLQSPEIVYIELGEIGYIHTLKGGGLA
jgi:hypothetical protein